MYKILVVDDEELIVKGIKSMIERMNHPLIGEVYIACEAYEAEELLEERQPDIVVTDIRMPDRSGLDLIRDASEQYQDVRFIILSGYEDFQYAKQAFKLGVLDYLLKPASFEELKNVLEKVVKVLESEKAVQLERIRNDMEYRRLMLESRLNKLLSTGSLSAAGVVSILDELGIQFIHPYFSTAIFSFPEEFQEEKVLEDAKQFFSSTEGLEVFIFFNYQNDLVLILNVSADRVRQNPLQLIRAWAAQLRQTADGEFFGALSETGTGTDNIPMLYKQAEKALAYRILREPYEIIDYADKSMKAGKLDLTGLKLNEFAANVKHLNMTEISQYIDSLFSRENLKDRSIDAIRRLYKSIALTISDASAERGDTETDDIFRDFYSFKSLADIRIYLKSKACNVQKMIRENAADRSVVDLAKKMILENYSRDINMAVVANSVAMSYNYFSKLFKDEAGMNFSDYLSTVRMEEAKRLLEDPSNRIGEVSASVGYDNPKHFTRAFKGYYGISPKDYRENR